MKPLVFVAMPFGQKPDALRNHTIDFDDIYERGIKPAVLRFDLECVRADEEHSGGVIHLPMFERLLLAEIAIVDVTLSNPNVFYELGVRHAARPRTTIIVGSGEAALPFDIAAIRAITYKLTNGQLEDTAAGAFVEALASRLEHVLEDTANDSPLFQLIPGLSEQTLPHEITDTFRDRAREVGKVRERLDAAKRRGKIPEQKAEALAEIRNIAGNLGIISKANAELFFEVFLTYRDLKAFDEMNALAESAPDWLLSSVPMLREQQAFALNRRNKADDRPRAVAILERLIEEKGHAPEASSLLGRIYKDEYVEALIAGKQLQAGGFLMRSIELYRSGFNADPRDYYPGVNLVTLLALSGTPDAREEFARTLPAVTFALGRLGGANSKDYWQLATILELAVLGRDSETALQVLARIATLDVEDWCLETTARNLILLRKTADGVLDQSLRGDIVAELKNGISDSGILDNLAELEAHLD